MSRFRTGKFARDEMPSLLRKFSPHESLATVQEVNLESLKESGKTLILLDVDNTLLPWRGNDVPSAVLKWLAQGKSLGFQFCILSNTRHPVRLRMLSELLGVQLCGGSSLFGSIAAQEISFLPPPVDELE